MDLNVKFLVDCEDFGKETSVCVIGSNLRMKQSG